jgi:AcrR family transcriptional regulator
MDSATRPTARRGRPPRADQVAARRRALLDAAGTIFRRDGYLAATVDGVADAAGLTKGAVYSHFTSKADVFLTLLEQRVARRRAANRAAADSASDRERAESFLVEANAVSREDPEWRLALLEFRVVAARDPELNARYQRVHAQAVAGIGETLTAMYDALQVSPPMPVEALARALLTVEAGSVLEEIVAGHPTPPDYALQLAARILELPDVTQRRSESR